MDLEASMAELSAAAKTIQIDAAPLPVGALGTVGAALVNRSIFAPVAPDARAALLAAVDSCESARYRRCCGAILGMAVGDAVGAPLEFMEAGSGVAAFDPDTASYGGEQAPRNMFDFKPGQWTDDTSMGLCLADSLLAAAASQQREGALFSGSDFVARLWNWNCQGLNNSFRHDAERLGDEATRAFMAEAGLDASASLQSLGCGKGMRRMLEGLVEGEEPPDAQPSGSDDAVYEGNAVLIRLAPVPVLCCLSRSPEACMSMARASAASTQNGPAAATAAAFLAFTMHRAMRRGAASTESVQAFLDVAADDFTALLLQRREGGDEPEPEPEQAQEWIRTHREAEDLVLRLLRSSELPDSCEVCWNWRSSGHDVTAAIANRGEMYNGHPVSREYFGAYALDGLAIALWAVYHSNSATAAIAKAANVLGDADSTACIAGQLAGSFYGDASIDRRLLDMLRVWDPDREIEMRAALLFCAGQA